MKNRKSGQLIISMLALLGASIATVQAAVPEVAEPV